MLETSLFALFVVGLLGGGHCLGMCGGLVTAFTLQLPNGVRRTPFLLGYNLGRIGSYTLIGALLGALSGMGLTLLAARPLQWTLYLIANLMLIGMGLYLAGLSSAVTRIEALGRPLWRLLQPRLARLLPVRSPAQAVAVGALWGWLPCGLVYSASLSALAAGNTAGGALAMLAFGLGTLPNLLAMGAFAEGLRAQMQKRPVRLVAGLAVMTIGLFRLAEPLLSGALFI
ncbi:sulfite exporter TauE/SafE family protein [Neisseriaceae bacterium JH1-16]|nr:sulfite exporter TauE/SafE family protein [Neisseriaceae bacterium JH1-16]